jgi:D-glycero-alpha-D-manno-heptose-7-phosphate kinase
LQKAQPNQIRLRERLEAALVIDRKRRSCRVGSNQYVAAFGGFNYMEFGRDGSVLVNSQRVKDWVASEPEASMLLHFTATSHTSAGIIE